MHETTTLAISKTDLDELRVQLERAQRLSSAPSRDELERVCDLFWEAIHCPPELTWLTPQQSG